MLFSIDRHARFCTLGLLALAGSAAVGQISHAPATARVGRPLVMVNAVYPPFINPVGHRLGPGIDVEIAREALKRAGYTMELKIVPWKRALLMLENGGADFTTTISKQNDRDAYLAWTPSYRTGASYRFYSRKESTLAIESLDDLNNKRLGVVAGFHYPTAIVEREGVYVVHGQNLTSVIKMLEAQRSDAIVVTAIAGAWEIREMGVQSLLKLQPYEYVAESRNYMAFSRKTDFSTPLAAMSRALVDMAKDGTIARITRQYQDG